MHKRRRSSSDRRDRRDRDYPPSRHRTGRDRRSSGSGRNNDRRERRRDSDSINSSNSGNSNKRRRSSGGGRKVIVCFGCQQPGHHIRDCKEKASNKNRLSFGGGTGFSNKFARTPAKKIAREDGNIVDEDQEIEVRLKSLLIRIGEKSQSSLEKNLELLTNALEEDAPQHKDFILKIIFQCVRGLPAKTTIYACLVGLLNIKLPKIGEEATKMLHEHLLTSLKNGYYDEFRILLRLMGTLVNVCVIDEKDFFDFLFLLLGYTQKQDKEHADLVIFFVISVLPWLDCKMIQNDERKKIFLQKISDVISKVEKYFAKRSFQPNILFTISHIDVLYKDDKDKLSEVLKYDYLVNFWHEIQLKHQKDSKNSEWEVPTSILTPHRAFIKKFNPETTNKLKLLDVFKPSYFSASVYDFRPDLRIFEVSRRMEVIGGIDRYIVGDYISDILILYGKNHKKGIKELMSLQVDMDYNHLVIEITLSHLIALPTSPLNPIYYGTIIIGFFKAKPKIMPPLLGQAINKMFLSIHTYDIEIRDRFAKWFSFHLSNFNYKWPWTNWGAVVDLSPKDPKQIFVCDVIVRCTRLAFWERVQQSLPGTFIRLMPSQSGPIPKFHQPKKLNNGAITETEPPTDAEGAVPIGFNANDSLFYPLSVELTNLFKTRKDCKDVLNWLNTKASKDFGEESEERNIKKLKLFLYTLLDNGKMSFSHTFALLDKYREVIETTNVNDATQALMMKAVAEFWGDDSLRIVIIVDRLVAKTMVSAAAAIDWVFTHRDVHKSYVWTILLQTVSKTLERIELHIANLKEKKKSLDVAMDDKEDEKKQDIKMSLERAELEKKEMFVAILERFRHMLNQKVQQNEYHLVESRFKVFCRTFSKSVAAYKSKVANEAVDPRVASVFKVFTQATKQYHSVPRKERRFCFC